MAAGDFTFFNEADHIINGGWEAADVLKVAILDNTTTPSASDTTPALGDYTEVGTAGNYVAGGASIGTVAQCFTQSGGVWTFSFNSNPSWTANASNDADARWGLVYNSTQAGNPAIGFIDLGGAIDMSANPLDLVPAANGVARFTLP